MGMQAGGHSLNEMGQLDMGHGQGMGGMNKCDGKWLGTWIGTGMKGPGHMGSMEAWWGWAWVYWNGDML